MDTNKEKLSGKAEELKGNIKHTVGGAINNPDMQAEGDAERLHGQARNEAAKAAERARGAAEELKGNLKHGVGDAVGSDQMEAEGEAERLKGQNRQQKNQ